MSNLYIPILLCWEIEKKKSPGQSLRLVAQQFAEQYSPVDFQLPWPAIFYVYNSA